MEMHWFAADCIPASISARAGSIHGPIGVSFRPIGEWRLLAGRQHSPGAAAEPDRHGAVGHAAGGEGQLVAIVEEAAGLAVW
jgi:hypothetical protein